MLLLLHCYYNNVVVDIDNTRESSLLLTAVYAGLLVAMPGVPGERAVCVSAQ